MDERIRYGLPLKDAQSSLLKASIGMMPDMLSDMRINATFFITASLAEKIADELKEIKNRRHQIGCHGLTHDEYDNYAKLPYNEQIYRIERATMILEDFVGVGKVTAFRAPGVRISATTLKILENLGYTADSSISSQRFDLSSNMNPKLIFAPRMPYHPEASDAYRRGSMKIWEIPISAEKFGNVQFVVGDALNLPFKYKSFEQIPQIFEKWWAAFHRMGIGFKQYAQYRHMDESYP